MKPCEIEKFAFWYFCGKKDRDLLSGKKKMSLGDLERFTFLTDALGLENYNIEIWNTMAGQFKEQFKNLERFIEEVSVTRGSVLLEEDIELRKLWIKDFCECVPNKSAQIFLEQYFELSSS